MLASIEPRQLDEWIAYLCIEPDEMTRTREVMVLGLTTLCRTNGANVEPEHIDPARKQEEKPQYVSPKLAAKMTTGAMGL